MTIGTIDENGESLIRLAISASAEARPYEVDAVLDTGFEGRLALPRAFIKSLNLRQTGHARHVTASGETHRTGTYRAAVTFGGRNVIIDDHRGCRPVGRSSPALGLQSLPQLL